MKKTLLLMASALFAGASFSQIYSADDAAAFGSWTIVDLDGDADVWGAADMTGFGSAIDGQGEVLASASWDGTSALTPDNLAVSPSMDLTGMTSATLEFGWGSPEATSGGFHEEHIAVYVTSDIAGLSTGTFPTPVFEMTLTEGDMMHWESIDVTAEAAGASTVYVAFRHYNCTDMNFVVVDEVEMYGSAASINENQISVSVYPNPTADVLNITLSQNAESVSIYSLDGKLLVTQTINGLSTSVDVAELAAGTYIYEVTSENGTARNTFSKK